MQVHVPDKASLLHTSKCTERGQNIKCVLRTLQVTSNHCMGFGNFFGRHSRAQNQSSQQQEHKHHHRFSKAFRGFSSPAASCSTLSAVGNLSPSCNSTSSGSSSSGCSQQSSSSDEGATDGIHCFNWANCSHLGSCIETLVQSMCEDPINQFLAAEKRRGFARLVYVSICVINAVYAFQTLAYCVLMEWWALQQEPKQTPLHSPSLKS